MIKKLLKQSLAHKQEERKADAHHRLIQHEARIGGEMFGRVPATDRRDFFCLDERTWVWHEEWRDKKSGERHVHTTRYEIRPDCVLKVRDGEYATVGREEAEHLLEAATRYQQRIRQQLYTAA